ncbi:uncharacterized protein [Elaeis guineensis]|uniref:Uncharacterized protein LOC105034000 n=1 Tax=Elaeis guineensis var. tenera TaxID=51953 RepID=A0A6I9QD47_ELAGV|nr:uncharacterized protein LOC105034000 [Elaeis guineensis]
MAMVALSPPTFASAFVPKFSPPTLPNSSSHWASTSIQPGKIQAKLGGGDGEAKRAGKKFITREEQPDQYWQTAGEREGENPMKTPLPYIIIFGWSTPFVILAIAFANGWIKMPMR